MSREQIAQNLINLAQEIAERRYLNKIAIESLSDEMLPQISNHGISAVVQDAVEDWAYTWLDYLQDGIDEPNAGDVYSKLIALPIERHYMGLVESGLYE